MRDSRRVGKFADGLVIGAGEAEERDSEVES